MSKKIKTVIVVLLALVVLSTGALIARVVYLKYIDGKGATTVVPNNLIGQETETSDDMVESPAQSLEPNETAEAENDLTKPFDKEDATETDTDSNEIKASTIKLYMGNSSDNEQFIVQNMLPGDSDVKYFAVKVNHHADAIVYFSAEVTKQTKNLADILHIKVTRLENDKVIYDGSFSDMDIAGYGELFAASQSTESVAYYKVEVSLPTSTGNEYQAAELMADFNWCVKDVDVLDPPQTGDDANIVLWVVIMGISFVLMIVLLFIKRRDREGDEGAEKQ